MRSRGACLLRARLRATPRPARVWLLHAAIPAAILYARQQDLTARFMYMTAGTYACVDCMQE